MHSISLNARNTKLLVGFEGGEIYESVNATRSVVALSTPHSSGEVRGLCVNPVDPDEYATVGDDGFLRIWSAKLLACVRYYP